MVYDGCEPDLGIVERGVTKVRWSPDGSKLAVASFAVDELDCFVDVKVEVIDAATRQTLYTFHQDSIRPIHALAWKSTGDELVTGGRNGTIHRWSIADGQLIRSYSVSDDTLLAIAYNPTDTQVVSGGWDNVIRLVDAETGDVVSNNLGTLEYPGLSGTILWIDWRPNSNSFASGAADTAVARVWDGSTLQPLGTFVGHTGRMLRGTWNHAGTKLATTSDDKTVKLWDGNTGQLLLDLIGHTDIVMDIRWSPADDLLATAGLDGVIRFWNAETGAIYTIIDPQHLAQVTTLDWHPNGQIAYGGTVYLDPYEPAPPVNPMPDIITLPPPGEQARS